MFSFASSSNIVMPHSAYVHQQDITTHTTHTQHTHNTHNTHTHNTHTTHNTHNTHTHTHTHTHNTHTTHNTHNTQHTQHTQNKHKTKNKQNTLKATKCAPQQNPILESCGCLSVSPNHSWHHPSHPKGPYLAPRGTAVLR